MSVSAKKLFVFFSLVFLCNAVFAQEDNSPSDSEIVFTENSFRNSTYDLSGEGQERDLGIFGKVIVRSTEEKRFLSDLKKEIFVKNFFHSKKLLAQKTDDVRFVSEQVPLLWREDAYERYSLKYKFTDFLWETFAVGFGLGNFMQDDFIAGPIFLATDLIAWITPVVGLFALADDDRKTFGNIVFTVALMPIALAVDIFLYPLSGGRFSCIRGLCGWVSETSESFANAMAPYIYTALILKVSGMIGSTICAAIRSRSYNKALSHALALDTGVSSIDFVPLIDPVDMRYGLAMQVKF